MSLITVRFYYKFMMCCVSLLASYKPPVLRGGCLFCRKLLFLYLYIDLFIFTNRISLG